ncbi:MAG: carboxylating nicotinate-nucleotide diphosphorylase [Proteobacteria bacterium]|nr:carboxylating nicotinate-nucleotide diphosphorylase [Pseudomonadota bacterium]MBU4298053.1 carboxylating nicotinate-nucleotide diphosphorylase [Pseudomonadota bacterium]MCG2746340.1 carboxylating nicotinate-nucleotide diphosphorylase [Desulfobulbaceae bacterium]
MNRLELIEGLKRFLAEDLGSGDLTSESIFADAQPGKARFIAKTAFVCAGMGTVAGEVFRLCNPAIEYTAVDDGTRVQPGDVLFTAVGPVIDLLRAERVALNLVQRLCGIATLTSRFVDKVMLLPVKIVDTRKTTPGLRMLEKYAVRVGGGYNHRFNLADGILIKDNHIAACGSIQKAVKRVREHAPHTLKIEVEAETLEQVESCLAADVDIIMLDNMTPEMMRQAVRLVKGRALLEASGGINLENVRSVAETGVNLISIGALTHSAPACDISMEMATL